MLARDAVAASLIFYSCSGVSLFELLLCQQMRMPLASRSQRSLHCFLGVGDRDTSGVRSALAERPTMSLAA